MPAMSPTMTEGNIASWKVKEGETFNPGDVLLEIETDKAQMDVEAQEEGVLAKILVPDGTHNVDVGKTIAILAEQGDDISALELPEEETQVVSPSPGSEVKSESRPTDEAHDQPSSENKSSLHFAERYSPAVLRLLQQYGIKDPKSVSATGPQGRLLKGDVLAHVGSISPNIPKELHDIIAKKQILDLSNIQIEHRGPPSQTEPPVSTSPKPQTRRSISNTVDLARLCLDGENVYHSYDRSKYLESAIEQAIGLAMDDVPAFRLRRKSEADMIFEELVGEKQHEPRREYARTLPNAPCMPNADMIHPNIEIIYGSKVLKGIASDAVLSFGPTESPAYMLTHESDIFDILLGVGKGSKKPPKQTRSIVAWQAVPVRLAYDTDSIAPRTAAEFLNRLQHHLENPVPLVATKSLPIKETMQYVID